MPKVFVAVTDFDWYSFLMAHPGDGDVNFWSPSPRRLAHMDRDTLVLFKLKARYDNLIVGGGFYTHFTSMSVGLAWDVFGEANGAPTLQDFKARIQELGRGHQAFAPDPDIGCTVLSSAFFLAVADALPAPFDFGKNTVRIKGYDLASQTGNQLFEQALTRRSRVSVNPFDVGGGPRYGTPLVVRPRRGQAAFRAVVTDAYDRRCAVTGERTMPVLEAAHIVPFADGGEHSTRNGILLRSDLHRLFDRGYIMIAPEDLTLRVSRAIRDEFHNGHHYYELDGRRIAEPHSGYEPLASEYLEHHRDSVFKAG